MIAAGFIDNGDRPKLADWVRERIKPQVDLFIDTSHIPKDGVDIVKRVKYIIDKAKGCDFLYLIENDDYYPEDYILTQETARHDNEFINTYKYIRYHINSRHAQIIGHKKGKYFIGGLWTMGFNPELVDEYFWQFIKKEERYLDGHLCTWFQDRHKCTWNNDHKGVAIKGHQIGKTTNQNGQHKAMNPPYVIDEDLQVISSLTDESFMRLHFTKYKPTKTNTEARRYLQDIFKLWPD